jgi:hypothetical protein
LKGEEQRGHWFSPIKSSYLPGCSLYLYGELLLWNTWIPSGFILHLFYNYWIAYQKPTYSGWIIDNMVKTAGYERGGFRQEFHHLSLYS